MTKEDKQELTLVGIVIAAVGVIFGGLYYLMGSPTFSKGDCLTRNGTVMTVVYEFDHGYELKEFGAFDKPAVYRSHRVVERDYRSVDCISALYSDAE